MRSAGLIFVVMLMAAGEVPGQSLEKISSISFTKQSRGFLDEIVISRDSVQGFRENHRAPENTKRYATEVSQDDWAKLMIALREVPLEDVDGLQSPTMNRAHDGALHSSIVITFEDGNTVTHSFDNENPHPDLQPLLDAILAFRIPGKR